jgi:hypothetical protein
MLYSEIIALFSDPHKTQTHCVDRTSRAVNTLRLGYKNQSVNAVQWNNRFVLIFTQNTHSVYLLTTTTLTTIRSPLDYYHQKV